MKLRPYQVDAVAKGSKFLIENHEGSALMVLPTGSGKSIIIAAIANDIPGNTLVLQPSKELLEQNYSKMCFYMGPENIGIYSASVGRKDFGKITFATIGSIINKKEEFSHFDQIIIDECFTGDTLISTPSGYTRIDKVRCGDKILSGIGIQEVEVVSVKEVSEILELKFSDGTVTRCTKNHPFFTTEGWKEAGSMDIGEVTFSEKGLSFLWELFFSMEENEEWHGVSDGRTFLGKAKILLNILLEEDGESDGFKISETEDEKNSQEDWSQTNKERGKRAVASFTTVGITTRPWEWLGSGTSYSHKEEKKRWLSVLLQDRYRESRKEDSHRGGRLQSYYREKKRAGFEEEFISFFPRLVSISSIKPESPTPVFNIQVSGHPSYFANGKLVHNCHLVNSKGGMYENLINTLKIPVLGLTATPYRLYSYMDTVTESRSVVAKFLHRTRPRIFKEIIHITQIQELYQQGFLCPIDYSQSVSGYDRSKIRLNSTGMDFDEESLMQYQIQQNVVKTVKEAIENSDYKHILVFASSVMEANEIAKQLSHLRVACVSAETSKDTREEILSGFKSGAIRVVTNVGVLTTGFDFPELDCIILARPTQSVALYYQMLGRGIRIAPGKQKCFVIDICGNVDKFGHIETFEIIEPKPRLHRLKSDASFLTGYDFFHGEDLESIGYANKAETAFKKNFEKKIDILSFGKFKGQKLTEVPDWYVKFIAEKFNPGWVRDNFKKELARRGITSLQTGSDI